MPRILYFIAVFCFVVNPSASWAGKTIEVTTSMNDVFQISETNDWNVKLERELQLRFADVRIDDKQGYAFSLMLYFKADTPDLAQFDTPEKMKSAIQVSSDKYLPGVIEKEITIKKIPVSSTYGFYTVLTDAELANKTNLEPGQFKYLTRGMVRLSDDTALGFSLMTNDVDSADYHKLLNYVYGFVKQ